MAVDTRNKRGSVLGRPGIIYANPDGTIGQADRQQAAGVYAGILAGALVAYLDPAGDVSIAWTKAGGPPETYNFEYVDDAVRSPNTGVDGLSLLATGSGIVVDQFSLTAAPAEAVTVSAIAALLYGLAAGSGGSEDIEADIYIAGAWLGYKALSVPRGSAGYGTNSWSGSWTKAQVNAANVRLRNANTAADSVLTNHACYLQIAYSTAGTAFVPYPRPRGLRGGLSALTGGLN